MAINVAVIDDEQFAVDSITRLIEAVPSLRLKKTFTDPLVALQGDNLSGIDLIFLDIEMPAFALDGYDLIDLFRGRFKIVVVTAYEKYALKGYEYDIVTLLHKPIRTERFIQAVHKAQALIEQSTQPGRLLEAATPPGSIFVKIARHAGNPTLQQVNLSDIRYLHHQYQAIELWLDDQTKLVLAGDTSLTKFYEEQLPKDLFNQVHRSYVVSKRYIHEVDGNEIVLSPVEMHSSKSKNDRRAGVRIPIGETFRESFREFINSGGTKKP